MLTISSLLLIITSTEPNTPLNDADHVGSFNFLGQEKFMGIRKEHQPPMAIEEQICNLKEIGLIIKDEEYARKILNDISYFRLIKAYSLGFKEKNGKYHAGVTFEQIVELYLFNANFRQITFAEIEKIYLSLVHDVDENLYLYDTVNIKKETSTPLEQ